MTGATNKGEEYGGRVAGLSTTAIVISVFLKSANGLAPLGRQLERGRNRLFDRGISGWKPWKTYRYPLHKQIDV